MLSFVSSAVFVGFLSLFSVNAAVVPVPRAVPVYELPPLDYPADALEPHVSSAIMQLHHDKHHQAYITNLNAAEAAYANLGPSDVKEKIKLQSAIKFNGGGHINHSLFWKNLAPAQSSKVHPSAAPKLVKAIESQWGTLADFQTAFNTQTAAIQGSGWGWLAWNPASKKLEIVATGNQDPLTTYVPIIGVDIWEHAFYLQYKNVKADYLKAIWYVINYEEAEKRFVATQ